MHFKITGIPTTLPENKIQCWGYFLLGIQTQFKSEQNKTKKVLIGHRKLLKIIDFENALRLY